MVMKIPITLLGKFAQAKMKKVNIIAWNKLTSKQREKVARAQTIQRLLIRAMMGDQSAVIRLNAIAEAEKRKMAERCERGQNSCCNECHECQQPNDYGELDD